MSQVRNHKRNQKFHRHSSRICDKNASRGWCGSVWVSSWTPRDRQFPSQGTCQDWRLSLQWGFSLKDVSLSLKINKNISFKNSTYQDWWMQKNDNYKVIFSFWCLHKKEKRLKMNRLYFTLRGKENNGKKQIKYVYGKR